MSSEQQSRSLSGSYRSGVDEPSYENDLESSSSKVLNDSVYPFNSRHNGRLMIDSRPLTPRQSGQQPLNYDDNESSVENESF